MRHGYGFHLKGKQEFPHEDLQRADLTVRGQGRAARTAGVKAGLEQSLGRD